MRVVSLVPSVTETLLALGAEVVACTRFCEQPGLRTVGGTKDPDVEAILALRPDLVVMNDEENRRADAEALAAAGLPVHDCSPRSVAEVGPAVRALAARLALEVPEAFREGPWAAWLARHPEQPARRPVFVPVWRRPWITGNDDTYGASLLARCGLRNVFGDAPDRYPRVALAEVADRRPALVLLPSEPYPFRARHAREITAALPGVPVRFVDGRDLFWWGIRTPPALARLRNLLAEGAGPDR